MVIHPEGSVPGSLARHLPRWKQLKKRVPPYLLNIIENGAPLLFNGDARPQSQRVQQHVWNQQTQKVLQQYVEEGLESGLLRKVDDPHSRFTVSSPVYAIPKKEPGCFRIILDLRHVNSFQQVPRFKMSGLKTVKTLIRPEDWMVKLDIKNAFHHLNVYDQHRRFTCFCFMECVYMYQALSMGSSASPYFLNLVMRPAIEELRTDGVRLIDYVDDILIFGESPEQCREQLYRVARLLVDLGWHMNWAKSIVEPTQRITFLGIDLDTTEPLPRFRVPNKKRHAIRHEIQRFLTKAQQAPIPKRHIARAIGLMQSVALAVGPTQMLSRGMIGCLNERTGWEHQVTLNQAALRDVERWLEILQFWTGEFILDPKVDVTLRTDASALGWGAALFQESATVRINGGWSVTEQAVHVNCKELLAVEKSIRRLGLKIRNKVVRLQSDNTTTVLYLKKMAGRKDYLLEVVQRIFLWLQEHKIRIVPEYLPGRLNVEADWESRHPDHAHWTLTKQAFQSLEERWGPHTVDRFALPENAQLPRFNTRDYHPSAEAVNGLLQPWEKENNYINPPFHMLEMVVQRLQTYNRVKATVIVPEWPGQAWFAPLMSMSSEVHLMPVNSVTWSGTGVIPRRLKRAQWRLLCCRI